ncbi:DSD1 family PLP-dependent enzyme [Allopusillimonas soli]|uniref:DSD1 family PLP-dependent enzyme n=1 Tax=Allopusillimonas soli TaxID=659016 RepID=A0A853FBY1_9BURK|nr:DSD1 family PLP-dependent enzyme [Allopusillimonas soli]NYT37278.1 DSD1 family PLP-dependent enzyme [Allopusillimonas soli]TEA74727.1 DSD1 family PLP-dependent enzyme [Allopusillimonas soli]
MSSLPANIGDAFHDIDTPALVVDLDAFEKNLKTMADFVRKKGLRLRPHAKTHRCADIALKQIQLGAVGQCCQKVGEAEALIKAGVRNIIITNQIVSEAKLVRLAHLARQADIALCFDDRKQVDMASRIAAAQGVELGALVEVDVGMKRCGVAPGVPACELAAYIEAAPALRFRGLQAYQGAAQHLRTYEARKAAVEHAAQQVQSTVDLLSENGISCEIVAGAGTGTYPFESAAGPWNELQAGSYIFMDAEYGAIEGADGGPYSDFNHSLFVLASVMSVAAVPGRAILDAGLKSFSVEKGMPKVHGLRDATVIGASDEHAVLVMDTAHGARNLALGDKVMLIPGHCDPTVSLHECIVGVRNGRVESTWRIDRDGSSR